MSPEAWSLVFGGASTLLYIGWAWFSWYHQPHMTWALSFYALANMGLMWPTIRLYL